MAANRPGGSSNSTLYFIVGALIIAVLIIGWFVMGKKKETPAPAPAATEAPAPALQLNVPVLSESAPAIFTNAYSKSPVQAGAVSVAEIFVQPMFSAPRATRTLGPVLD